MRKLLFFLIFSLSIFGLTYASFNEIKPKIDNKINKFMEKVSLLPADKAKGKVSKALSKIEEIKNNYSGNNKEFITKVLNYLKFEIIKKLSLLENDLNSLNDKKVPVVYLKDGDTYTLEVSQIEKEIGNAKVIQFAYNGYTPGPIIRVKKGSTVTIKLVNKIKGIETTLHSHGLRLDNKFDGVPEEMGGHQKAIKYGETFTYKLKFPDEGIFWYHPHVREDFQQEMGLYGNYIVDPVKTKYWNKVNREETLILDDILLDGENLYPFYKEFANFAMKGRYGNIMMINGQANYNLKVRKGESIRFYFTNVANTRVFQVKIPGVKLKLVGGDMGKYEKEEFIDSFIIAPAERYVVEAYFDKVGTYNILNSNPWFEKKLGTITVIDEEVKENYKKEFDDLRINKDTINEMNKYRKYLNKKYDKFLKFSIGMKGMRGGMMGGGMGMMGGGSYVDETIKTNPLKTGDRIEWFSTMGMMNARSNTARMEWKLIDGKGNTNMDINWNFKVGDKVKIRLYNDPNSMHPMQHPIHFHGQRFLILSRNGKENKNMVWKDTVLVPTGEYVDILLDITNPGKWMAHCHIAEHLTAGMMMNFVVEK